jgi:rhodanese-related sulfurtransferase
VKKVLLEGLLVAVLGAIAAFTGNALSPRGLQFTRDYFPAPTHSGNAAQSTGPGPSGSSTNSEWDNLAARLKEDGLGLIDSRKAMELFQDPRRQQGLVIFVDARNPEHYQEGHIPGAYEFDYYHYDNYLATVVPACQNAQQVVVYCTGGKCDDSRLAANFLGGIMPKEKLKVYGGGITEWMEKRLPVEKGPRGGNPGQ